MCSHLVVLPDNSKLCIHDKENTMSKNRILSIILLVMMLFTIVFPTGVIAEGYEPQGEDTAIVDDNGEDAVIDEILEVETPLRGRKYLRSSHSL